MRAGLKDSEAMVSSWQRSYRSLIKPLEGNPVYFSSSNAFAARGTGM
jgi:hypothetical protein